MPVERHPYSRVFTAGVGTVEAPIDDDWRAEEQNYLWSSAQSRQVSKGDHMFALLRQALAERAAQDHETTSAVIRKALCKYLQVG